MKQTFLLISFFIVSFFSAFSQQNNIAFAITGQESSNFNWADIRAIDMTSGITNETLFENGKTKFSFLDAETMRSVDQSTFSGNFAAVKQNVLTTSANKIIITNPSPTALMSAAIAYDKRHDKLFFASMHTGQLIWLDRRSNTSQPVFYTIQKKLVDNVDVNDEAFDITRMTIGADGNGYALTNDGDHLVRFTTGNKVVITDLGNLVDDESNNGISVHNKCSSWGGDIVGDAFGKLYLFTASRNVFVIDPETRIATYKGTISNLSATFSVNGAAVIDDDNVIVSTANTFEGFYKVNINSLSAIKIVTPGKIYNASDLASCNLLRQQEKQNSLGEPVLKTPDVIGNRFISVYPNPVTDGQMKITFDGNVAGKYKILLTDILGRFIISKEVYVKGPGQVENVQTRTKQASGMYMIKITDETGKPVFADKLFFQ